MSLLWLPAELQLLTLGNLSFRDLLRCRALCRHFRTLIDSSKELAFVKELGAAGVKDNEGCPDSMKKKVEKLWKSNIAWSNLHWLCRRQIQLSGTGKLFDVSEGLFFHTPESSESDMDTDAGKGTMIEWFKLPSRREPNPEYLPKRVTFNAPLVDLAVDASQDLIIGVELTNFRTSRHYTITCNLFAKSISTDEIHPSAARLVLSTRFVSPITNFEPQVEICGDHVGVLLARQFGVTNPDSFDMFLLWDWTTGTSKANMWSYGMEEFWETFCFLTTDSVLIPSAYNSLLNVYHFDNNADSLKHEISLLLPEPLERDGLRHIRLRSRPSSTLPYSSHPTGDAPPFKMDPDEAVIILSLDYRYHRHCIPEFEDDGSNLPQVVAIPRRVLTHFARLAHENSTELMSSADRFHDKACPLEHSPGTCGEPRCEHEWLYSHALEHPQYKRSPHLHAEQWIQHTRWSLDSVAPSMGCYAYGSRFIGMSSRIDLPDAPDSSIALYDFNLRNERRGYAHVLKEENERPYPAPHEEFNEDEDWDYDEETGNRRWPVYPSRIVTAPNIVSIPQVFKRPFTTSLPYRVTETEMVLPWDSAVIDGERIIGLEFSDYDAGSVDVLDIMVI